MRCEECGRRITWGGDTGLCSICELAVRAPNEVAARTAALIARGAGCDCSAEIRTTETAWGWHAAVSHEAGCRMLLREMSGDN